MIDVVLLFDPGCPNVAEARPNLLQAFGEARVPAAWREINRAGNDTPAELKAFGSPTILVNSRDVAETEAVGGACCRVFEDGDALARAPSPARIVEHLLSAGLETRSAEEGHG